MWILNSKLHHNNVWEKWPFVIMETQRLTESIYHHSHGPPQFLTQGPMKDGDICVVADDVDFDCQK